MAERVPPGRAGRLWLLGRLASARRSVDLLDRKRKLLQREDARLAGLCDETRRGWEIACVDGEKWGLRATVLGGASDVAVAAAAVAGRASVDLTWRNTMGVSHPDVSLSEPAVLPSAQAAAANAAVGPAAAAYRRALEAAVAHAAADMSRRVVNVELRATERRQRAIERHRLPALEEALARLELRLDELERDERVVARWAQQRRLELRRSRGQVPHEALAK
jgi:V/A-type H+-transporting ATPase subunit D